MLQGAGQPAPLRSHHGGEAPQLKVRLSPCETLCLDLVLDGLHVCAKLSQLWRGRSGSVAARTVTSRRTAGLPLRVHSCCHKEAPDVVGIVLFILTDIQRGFLLPVPNSLFFNCIPSLFSNSPKPDSENSPSCVKLLGLEITKHGENATIM